MARFFDSKQTFEQRVKELRLGELLDKFKEQGWTSFSALAFATDFVPGTSAPGIFVDEIVKPLVGELQADVDKWKPLLKRLFVEAYTMAAHDIQTRTEGTDPDEPRRMPNAEREHRLAVLQARLPGLQPQGELQPSFHLIDLCSAMFESGQVSYIPWEKCSKRDAESNGTKIEKIWKPDAEGRIRETTTVLPPKTDAGTDLLLRYALQRRGLALEIACVCDYHTHELWVQILMDALLESPPPGYAKLSMNQLRMADEKVWQLVGRMCRAGLRWGPGESPPFDAALKKVIYDPSVRLLLMPLPPLSSTSSSSGNPPPPSGDGLSRTQRKKLAKQRAVAKTPPPPAKLAKANGKGKDRPVSNDQAMSGKCRNTTAGDPICFNYNIRGCPNAQPGAKCPRGWHLCAEQGCQKAHPMTEHRS